MIELRRERRVEQSRRKNSICSKKGRFGSGRKGNPRLPFQNSEPPRDPLPLLFEFSADRISNELTSLIASQIETIKSRTKLCKQVFLISVIALVIKAVEMSRAKYQSVSFDYSINVLWLLSLHFLLRCKAKGKPAKSIWKPCYMLQTTKAVGRLRNSTGDFLSSHTEANEPDRGC